MDVELADGRTVSIDTADPAIAAAAAHKFQQANPLRSNTGDFFKSIPRGMLSGLSRAMSAGGEAAQLEMGQPVDVPSPQETVGHLEKNVTGPLPQPQGRFGQLGASVGESLGNPASYVGPGGLATKAITAITGGLGSEGARQAAEGSKYETAAELAGGAVGGGLGAVRRGTPIPTAQELKAAGRSGYKAAGNLGVEVESQGVANMATKMRAGLEADGINAELAPKTFRTLDKLENPPSGSHANIQNFETARKVFGNIEKDAKDPLTGKYTTEGVAALQAKRGVSDYLENLPASDLLAGDAAQASSLIKEANANYGAGARSETLAAKQERARLRAAGANSGQNLANASRQRVADILLSPKLAAGWSPDELVQANRVVEGTRTGNVARRVANLLAAGGGSGQLVTGAIGAGAGAGAGAYLGGTPEGAAIGGAVPLIVGALAKGAHVGSVNRQIRLLDEMLRSRSPLAQSRMQPPNYSIPAAALRGLITQ